MSHPLLVMPLPFRTVRSLRRRSKDNTGLNLQGPDVNRESREQISGQHRGVRRSPWMPLKRASGRQEPFWATNGRFTSRNLGRIWRGSRGWIPGPPRGAPAQLQPVSAGFAGSRSSPAPDPEAGGLREPGGPRGARRLSERPPPRTPEAK